MQAINLARVILMGLFFSSSFVESKELRVKRSSVQLIEDVGRLVSGLYTELQKKTDEIKAEFKKELEETRSAVSARQDEFDRKLQEITEQNRNNSKAFNVGLDGIKASISLLDGKTQELTRALGSADVKHMELQKNITNDLAQTIGSLLNLTLSTLRNETIQSHEIAQWVNETLITTRRISELPHDKEWIVIQRRGTPLKPGKTRQDFNRPWIEYAEGFGDCDADFWIGLDKMHQLTSAGYTQLRFDLEDWEGNMAYAQYNVFRISSATDKYRITFGGYNGNAGDSLIAPNNQKQFSTADRDNDGWAGNCAQEHGPWWHGSCSEIFLNNIYHNQSRVSHAKGIHWYGWKGFEYSLKWTSTKIRRPTNETLIADECSRI